MTIFLFGNVLLKCKGEKKKPIEQATPYKVFFPSHTKIFPMLIVAYSKFIRGYYMHNLRKKHPFK